MVSSDWNDTDYTVIETQLADYSMDTSVILKELRSELYRHKDPFIIVLSVLYVLTFLAGIIGNLFVILVVVRQRHMRTLTNVFFLNLTIGDLMVVSVCIPITLGNHIYKDWIYGEILCKATPFLQGTAVGVSVLSMLFISINRYFAIHIPLKAKIIFSKGKVIVMLVSIWLASFVVVSPLLFVNVTTTYGVPEIFEARICEERWQTLRDKQMYNIFIFGAQFVLPLLVMAAMYMRISQTLWTEDEVLHGSNTRQQWSRQLLRQRRRTVRNLIFLVILFGCSWFPYYVINIWLDFHMKSDDASVVLNYIYPLVQIIGLSNSTMNPLCYCFLSRGFRRAFRNMCCTKKKRTKHGMVITVRFKYPRSGDESGFDSIETVLS